MSAIWPQEMCNGKTFASIPASMLDIQYLGAECRISTFRLTSETEWTKVLCSI